jgi:hypothetical protein
MPVIPSSCSWPGGLPRAESPARKVLRSRVVVSPPAAWERRDDRLYALWLLVATTGMRRAELAGLRWVDIDLDAARLSPRRPRVVINYVVQESEPKTRMASRRSERAGLLLGMTASLSSACRPSAKCRAEADDAEGLAAYRRCSPGRSGRPPDPPARAGKVLVSTPIAIRSGRRGMTAGVVWPAPGIGVWSSPDTGPYLAREALVGAATTPTVQ